MIYNKVLEQLKRNKQFREEGKDIAIPFPFPRFAEEIPGIQQGRYIIDTANSKVGKTKFTDFIFVYNVFRFATESSTNIQPKIKYFSLEMSKEDKLKEALSFFLYVYKSIRISPDKMDSLFKSYILDAKVLKAIEDLQPTIEKFEEMVEFIDATRNPYGIYKYIRSYAHSHGHYVDKKGNKLDMSLIESNDETVLFKIHSYIPDNPNEYLIIVVDNYNNFTPENGETLFDAIHKFSSNYALRIRDRWKYILVAIQQQAAATESVENARMDMLKPTANGLGDCKLSGRDCDMMLGLFAPVRYKRAEYEGYDIKRLQDNHRELSVIFNRRGSAVAVQLYFDGCVNFFKELPKAEKMTSELYKKIENNEVSI
jgi:hypothetical protein